MWIGRRWYNTYRQRWPLQPAKGRCNVSSFPSEPAKAIEHMAGDLLRWIEDRLDDPPDSNGLSRDFYDQLVLAVAELVAARDARIKGLKVLEGPQPVAPDARFKGPEDLDPTRDIAIAFALTHTEGVHLLLDAVARPILGNETDFLAYVLRKRRDLVPEGVTLPVGRIRTALRLIARSTYTIGPFFDTTGESQPTPASGTATNEDATIPEIPPLDTSSPDWMKNKDAARHESVESATLSSYRQAKLARYVAKDKMSGIDRDGRMWRRPGLPRSHPWYYKPSLKSGTQRK